MEFRLGIIPNATQRIVAIGMRRKDGSAASQRVITVPSGRSPRVRFGSKSPQRIERSPCGRSVFGQQHRPVERVIGDVLRIPIRIEHRHRVAVQIIFISLDCLRAGGRASRRR